MVANQLDTLREESIGSRAVAFADLSTRMILVTDTQSNLTREKLDALCEQAASVLGVDGTATLGASPCRMALLADNSSVRLFLRATDEPNDVLCCVCAPNVDLDDLVVKATECLSRISGG